MKKYISIFTLLFIAATLWAPGAVVQAQAAATDQIVFYVH